MKRICVECGEEFELVTTNQLTCGLRCRLKYNRKQLDKHKKKKQKEKKAKSYLWLK